MSAATGLPRADDAELALRVATGAAALAMPLSRPQIDRLVSYVRLIERWNDTYNVTAVRDARDMVTQHLMDCLAAAAALLRRRGNSPGAHLLDVGSGAGLPGLVIAVVAPEAEIVCVDSVGKKAAFITHAAIALGLQNVSARHCRVEAMSDRGFDVITSRAFASLVEFVGTTKHLLTQSGTWMAMKGKSPTAELRNLERVKFHVEPLWVPGLNADRCIVWIEPEE